MTARILKEAGSAEYEPRPTSQVSEVVFRYVAAILDGAKINSSHAKKATVHADGMQLAMQCLADQSSTSPTPRDLFRGCRTKNTNPFAIDQATFRP